MKKKADRRQQSREIFGAQEVKKDLTGTNDSMGAHREEDCVPIICKGKDTVFRMLYREKEELLSLYNAVNGTCYEDPDDLEVTTLENAIYLNMKNDVSCVLDM